MDNNIVKYEIIDDLPDRQKATNQLQAIKSFQDTIRTSLVEDLDYGVAFKGAEKPSLYKSGAEKIIMILGLRSSFSIEEKIEDHEKGYFFYSIKCQLIKNGEIITEGLGSCNSKEGRYILKEKKNFKTGEIYYTPTTEEQKTYAFTMANTILKMAKKRAMVDAVLIFACLSNIFTQDLEDIHTEYEEPKQPIKKPQPNISMLKQTSKDKYDHIKAYNTIKNLLIQDADTSDGLSEMLLADDKDFDAYLFKQMKLNELQKDKVEKIIDILSNDKNGKKAELIAKIEGFFVDYTQTKAFEEANNNDDIPFDEPSEAEKDFVVGK